LRKILVTGGAGFIGSNFVRYALEQPELERLVILDKLTYAGSLLNLDEPLMDPRVRFVQGDISDAEAVNAILDKENPEGIVNFAAETHVDRSIDGPAAFVQTNLIGVFTLLEASRAMLQARPELKPNFRFLQVSTDEVFGSLGAEGQFREDTPYAPNSPYSASKAGADHLVRAYVHTYGLNAVITNCSNNYGPWQFPEKLIPLMILNALEAKALPVYGDGGNIRDWLHVRDHCAGVWMALCSGGGGEKYNIGGRNERSNLQVLHQLCLALEQAAPAADNPAMRAAGKKAYKDLVAHVPDRPGHDRRYAIDADKIRKQLGWKPTYNFESGLAETVAWYVKHKDWCAKVQEGKYQRERLGKG
jgi:dTDP-glucose 4,6-dehydratase